MARKNIDRILGIDFHHKIRWHWAADAFDAEKEAFLRYLLAAGYTKRSYGWYNPEGHHTAPCQLQEIWENWRIHLPFPDALELGIRLPNGELDAGYI